MNTLKNLDFKEILTDSSPWTPEDNHRLVLVFVFSFIGFWLTYFMSSVVMEKQHKNKIYQEMSSTKKADYLSRIVANVHAFLAVILSLLIFFSTW